MFVLFVSDIHLCNKEQHIVDSFLHFLYYYAINAKALYILGDLFEIWVGDDDPNPLHKKISDALQYLHQHNTKCYFIHGNHDFLLGEKYAKDCGMILLPNYKVLKFYGHRIILLHGDTLYINDNNYYIFKKYVHNTLIQGIFLTLPISLRLYIARIIQNTKNTRNKNITFEINQKKIKRILDKTNTEIMIHGHFHKAKIYYKIVNNDQKIERVVLGNWGNTGSIIKIDKNGIHLKEFISNKTL